MTIRLRLTFRGSLDNTGRPCDDPAPFAPGHVCTIDVGGGGGDPSAAALIGRGADCDLVLTDPSVGRRVVAITRRSGALWADDLGSGGGCSLRRGSEVLDRPAGWRLAPGDQLAVGRLLFDLDIESVAP